MSVGVTTASTGVPVQTVPTCVAATTAPSSTPSNPVPTSMLSFRFATPNNTQTPYYISSDIVLSGGIAQQNRRRIVHNEVEKRRKDKITNWIKKLAELLPRHRVLKQSKNYVLESACEYIEELREMNAQYGPLKSSKQKLEKEVAELRNKVNKLEDENKRLSQLIHQNKVAIPTTWSDASVITATMRATSSTRKCTAQTSLSTTSTMCDSSSNCVPTSVSPQSQASVSKQPVSGNPPSRTTSSRTNRLSVTSILSNTNNQPSTGSPTTRKHVISTQSTSVGSTTVLNPTTSFTGTRSVLPSSVLAVTWATTPSTSHSTSATVNAHGDTSGNTCTGHLQPLVVTQVQSASYPMVVASVPNQGAINNFPQRTITTSSSFERGFPTVPMRPNTVQENISHLPYSIDALTGNQSSQSRHQNSVPGQVSSFSAEALIGRQELNSEMVIINNTTHQPVIQNTFTLSHPTTLTNTTPHSSAPPQTFSNFSALSLVGNSTSFTGSVSSTAPTLVRSANTVPDTASVPHSSNQMFTDFSTESLIGPSEFSSDFAIDNLISRSDSNVHMTAVNPNLIQSFGKGNDPMISSVSGDQGAQSSSLHDPAGPGTTGAFSSFLPFGNSFGSGGQVSSKSVSDQTNMSLFPSFSTILSPPLLSRPLETSIGQRSATSNSTNFFSGTFPTPFQVS